MKKKLIVVSLLMVLVLVLAGCGSSEPEEDASEEAAAGYTVFINTEGMGQVAYSTDGETPAFDDEYPQQSAQVMVEPSGEIVLGAKADEEWKFIKWTMNDEDYSTDEQITVTVTADMNLVAYFDVE